MYLLKESTNLSEIGRYPQLQDSNIYKDAGTHTFGDFLSILDKRFQIECLPKLTFTLHYRAKITDSMITSGCLLINEKFLKIIITSNIENYQYFEVEVIHRKKQYEYYLFFIFGQNYDLVDYKNMNFIAESDTPYGDYYREPHERIGTQKKVVKIQSYEELFPDIWTKLHPDYPNWSYENLILKKSMIHTDMIRTPSFFGNYYMVSERLKSAIIELGSTGIDFSTKDYKEKEILFS